MKVLLLGAEASGNRLVGRILLTAGEVLEPLGHFVTFTHQVALPSGELMQMTARSLPHGEEWPDVDRLIESFEPDKILLVWRDRYFQSRSTVAAEHVNSIEQAHDERDKADRILASVKGDVHVIIYELLVHDPVAQVQNLGRWLGAELRVPEEIYNGDLKHA